MLYQILYQNATSNPRNNFNLVIELIMPKKIDSYLFKAII